MPLFFQIEGLWINTDRIRAVAVEDKNGKPRCHIYLIGEAENQRKECKGDTAKRLIQFLEAHEAKGAG